MNQTGQPNPASSPITVFVVDDEPMLLDLAAAILEPQGFEVRTFRDPQVAMQAYAQAQPDLLVTDYAMGEVNGMDLIRECRRTNPQQKIILVSGTVDEGVYANEPVKPDCFLAKPYQVQAFVELVKKTAGV